MFSEVIRRQSGGICTFCKRSFDWKYKMEASHYKSRRNKSVRWDFRNVDAVCRPCHWHLSDNPDVYVAFKKHQLGEENYDELILDANSIKKWTKKELLQLRTDLLEDLKRLKWDLGKGNL